MAAEEQTEIDSVGNLRRRVLSSLAWLSTAKAIAQLVAWFVTFKVISILDPADYGLLALAMVSVGFLAVFNELGLAAAIIQRRDLDEVMTRKIFAIVISVNMVMFVAAMTLAPLIAAFFDDERLIDLIRVLALKFPLMSLSIVPSSLIARRMEFKKTATIDLIGQIVSSLLTLVLALRGFGVWSLVFGTLGSVLARIILLNIVSPFLKLPIFRLDGMGGVFTFSLNVLASRLLFALFSQLDILIAGKALDRTALGIYSVAVHVANMPMFKLMSIVNQVAFPAYSLVQEDSNQTSHYFLKSIRLLTVLSVAALWGISAVSPEIVALLLSEKWASTQLPLQLVALIVPVRMVSQMTSSMLIGCGRPNVALSNLVIICVLMGAALMVGSQWDAAGMAWAWVLAFPWVTAVVVRRATAHLSVDLRQVAMTLWRPVFVGAIMYAAITLVRPALMSLGFDGIALLTMLIAVGVGVYLGGLILAAPAAVHELASLAGVQKWFRWLKTDIA